MAPADTVAPSPEVVEITVPEVTVPETSVVLENEFLRVELTSRAGAIKSCYLKKYAVQLVPAGQTILSNNELGNRALMGVNSSDSAATFVYQSGDGILAKTWKLGRDYSLELGIAVEGDGGGQEVAKSGGYLTFNAEAGIALTEKNVKEDLTNFHFYARDQGKVHQVAAASLRRKPFVTAADWVGLKSKYFFLALLNKDSRFDSCWAEALEDGRIGFKAQIGAEENKKGSGARRFLVYLGPIEYNRLRSFGLGFENVVSLGWLKPIALGILYLLRLFYSVVRNWGVAIVLFSILMKGAFYPLTKSQTRQMRQLQLMQPKIEELKKKYKNDPQALNQETMRLYQMYKVNPLSGCLPLLVQMPVFFALYTVLRNFIELRGAGFILWLKDLSQPDTLFGHLPSGIPLVGGFAIGLLPILMGASFIAQNLLTATDKKNWAMIIIFPIFITAIFLNLSSGLQLYWFIYNILSIGESLIVTKGGAIWQRFRKTPNLGVS